VAGALLLALAACAGFAAAAAEPVHFDWYEYTGRDAAFEQPLPPGHYRNPILAGYYPDPSIVRANGRYYLVNSSFTHFPGIPVFESTDLVHWNLIGHVIDRPGMMDFDGLGTSRGIFAPTIEYHDGTFYVVTTAVDAGGNFYVTAKDPAGPWSDPVWLPDIEGIDPSFFFDDDGKVYIINNDAPEGPPRYEGHRAIWMQEMDLAAGKPVGPRRVLLDGGMDPSTNPIWIEGPHIYKRDGWYYLVCAEGGTSVNHSQVVARSRNIWGPYEPYEGNPILTQRDLPADRPAPIANAGHADLVEGPDGRWWAVFLASRLYEGRHYNTGRETFLLPVEWEEGGWPRILPRGEVIPRIVRAPATVGGPVDQAPWSGNFTWRDDFNGPTLDRSWIRMRIPKTEWADLSSRPGMLAIHPQAENLDTLHNPAFLGRRQQHLVFEASTALEAPAAGVAAGLAAVQSEQYWFFLGTRRADDGLEVFLERRAGDAPAEVLASRTVAAGREVKLKIAGNGGAYSFGYDTGGGWQWLVEDADGRILSTEVAGGFVGAVLGPFAREEGAR